MGKAQGTVRRALLYADRSWSVSCELNLFYSLKHKTTAANDYLVQEEKSNKLVVHEPAYNSVVTGLASAVGIDDLL